MLEEIIQNRYAVTAVILFGIGFTNLMLQQNLLRKVIGFNIMDSAVFLLLASLGYIDGVKRLLPRSSTLLLWRLPPLSRRLPRQPSPLQKRPPRPQSLLPRRPSRLPSP